MIIRIKLIIEWKYKKYIERKKKKRRREPAILQVPFCKWCYATN